MRTLDVWYAHMSEKHIREAMEALQQEASTAAKSRKGKSGKKRAKATKSKSQENPQLAMSIKASQEGTPEGARPRQPARALPVRRGGGRQVPHRQPAPGSGAGA